MIENLPSRTVLVCLMLCHPVCLSPAMAQQNQEVAISFKTHIAPILVDNCVSCHCAKKAEGGYRIDTIRDLMLPGDSSVQPVVAKKSDASYLVQRIVASDLSTRMPPDSEALTTAQIQLLRSWIDNGASFDSDDSKQHLSLIIPPITYPAPPTNYPALPVTALSFTPDGAHLVSSGYHELLVWNATDGKLVRRIGNVGQRAYAIAFSPDGSLVAVACGEPGKSGELRLIDWAQGSLVSVLARSTDVVLDVAFRPGRDELAMCGADHSVRIINYRTAQVIRAYSSHADWVTAIAFSGDGKQLVSASRDKSAKVFDLESGQMLVSYAEHGAPVRGAAFLADGKEIVSVGDDKKLHRWQVSDAKKIVEIALGGEAFHLSRTGNGILIPVSSRQLVAFDPSSNKLISSYQGLDDWANSCSAAPDGRVVGGSSSGTIKIWAADAKELVAWQAHP